MKTYEKLLNDFISNQIDTHFLMAIFIANRLKKNGVSINSERFIKLKSQIKLALELKIDFLKLDFIDEEIALNLNDLSNDEEINNVKKISNRLISGAIKTMISVGSNNVLKQLQKDTSRMLKEHKKYRDGFEKRLLGDWGNALGLFETFLVIAAEAGDRQNQDYREGKVNRKLFVYEVLSRLQARACQIGYEILTLLKAGYADGAHARWRSLHEISVIVYHIKKGGNKVAERYIDYLTIDDYKAALLHNKHFKLLKSEPFKDAEIDLLKKKRDTLVKKYGNEFTDEYGWAIAYYKKIWPKRANRKVNFAELEDVVGLSHLRPYYKLASYNVHVNTWRAFSGLGLDEIEDDILLTGPSNMGLAMPAQSTSISILQITLAFLTIEYNIDNVITCKILEHYNYRVQSAFLESKEKLLQKGRNLQSDNVHLSNEK